MPPKKKAPPSKVETPAAEGLPELLDATQPEAAISCNRHAEFYFDTGDIAILCDTDEPEAAVPVMFRLDKSYLARHSSVLATKFQTINAPGQPMERYEGVPLFRLAEDAYVLEDLFSFMYNPAALFPCFNDYSNEATPARIINLLEIAKKYNVSGVKPFVLHFLEKDWPPTFVEWYRQQAELVRLKELWLADSDTIEDSGLDDMAPDPTTAIRIGLAYDMPSILPAAFYCLSEIDLEDDWDRWHLEEWDFSECTDIKVSDPTLKWRRTARWTKISNHVLLQVLLGKKALQARKAVLSRVYKFEVATDGTKPKESCQVELDRLVKEYTVGTGNPEPLQTLYTMMRTNRKGKLCGACRRTVRANIDKEMKMLWDDLPHIFSFEQGSGESDDGGSETQVAEDV